MIYSSSKLCFSNNHDDLIIILNSEVCKCLALLLDECAVLTKIKSLCSSCTCVSIFSVSKKEDSCVLGELNPTPPKILNDKVR